MINLKKDVTKGSKRSMWPSHRLLRIFPTYLLQWMSSLVSKWIDPTKTSVQFCLVSQNVLTKYRIFSHFVPFWPTTLKSNLTAPICSDKRGLKRAFAVDEKKTSSDTPEVRKVRVVNAIINFLNLSLFNIVNFMYNLVQK